MQVTDKKNRSFCGRAVGRRGKTIHEYDDGARLVVSSSRCRPASDRKMLTIASLYTRKNVRRIRNHANIIGENRKIIPRYNEVSGKTRALLPRPNLTNVIRIYNIYSCRYTARAHVFFYFFVLVLTYVRRRDLLQEGLFSLSAIGNRNGEKVLKSAQDVTYTSYCCVVPVGVDFAESGHCIILILYTVARTCRYAEYENLEYA